MVVISCLTFYLRNMIYCYSHTKSLIHYYLISSHRKLSLGIFGHLDHHDQMRDQRSRMCCNLFFLEKNRKSYTYSTHFSRSKNTVNILIKNWLDMCIGALVYWAVGFALTFGDSFGRFLGTSYFFFASMPGTLDTHVN